MKDWTLIYVEDGKTKVLQFDKYSMAVAFMEGIDEIIGLMTTPFFNTVKCVFEEKRS